MASLKNLPIGIQTFEKIITNNYLYVDKTQYLYDLIQGGAVYFFARPRRFGKSLTISTLKAIFEGKRELFKGLAIDQLEYDWKPYPVLRLDMGLASGSDKRSVADNLIEMLETLTQRYNIPVPPVQTPNNFLARIIAYLKNHYQQRVVVLVDEYDKPLLDVIENQERVVEARDELRMFYAVLKDFDEDIRFLFLTGVSQFAKMSIFSGLNQLKDISLIEQASSLCGYTDEEVDRYFSDYCHRMMLRGEDDTRGKLKIWYNGYKFHQQGPAMYNPFSVLSALDIQEFRNYWFSTGTPTFLINLLKKYHFNLHSLNALEVPKSEISELVIEDPQWSTIMYQTGYATICDYNPVTQTYSLRIPNKEIHFSFFDRLLKGYIGNKSYNLVRPLTIQIYRALVKNDWPLVIEHLKTIFAKIPYEVSIPLEAYYQTIFYTSLLLSGLQVVVEETTNDGRIDCVVTTPTHRYIIEMKLDKPLAETFEQIERKQYAAKYADDERDLVEIGVIFDSKKRIITDWDLRAVVANERSK